MANEALLVKFPTATKETFNYLSASQQAVLLIPFFLCMIMLLIVIILARNYLKEA